MSGLQSRASRIGFFPGRVLLSRASSRHLSFSDNPAKIVTVHGWHHPQDDLLEVVTVLHGWHHPQDDLLEVPTRTSKALSLSEGLHVMGMFEFFVKTPRLD
ncbi:hypothetical protein KC19_3G145800 [Ceratodon purpureus]|uniref:Uncharacterized protein n=1 Tax=Ceratodon purpureus TaxID=3225 RepID=A0A8T0IKY8_CERPU|nr:hypothetical protein KC19_3G145800 [Ceratodon purpureus]